MRNRSCERSRPESPGLLAPLGFGRVDISARRTVMRRDKPVILNTNCAIVADNFPEGRFAALICMIFG